MWVKVRTIVACPPPDVAMEPRDAMEASITRAAVHKRQHTLHLVRGVPSVLAEVSAFVAERGGFSRPWVHVPVHPACERLPFRFVHHGVAPRN